MAIHKDDICNSQKLPSVEASSCPVYIVRIPGEYRPECSRIQIQGSFEGWRIMKSQVGAEPVDDSSFGHWI
jgi:hypothetical protein